MATIKFFVNGTKRKSVPVYVRLCAGRDVNQIEKTGLSVNPSRWSNKTETIKQRITTAEDDKLIKKLKELYDNIDAEVKNHFGEYSEKWLRDVIYKFYNKRAADAKTLNEFVSQFIKEAEEGEKDFTNGYTRVLKGFQGVLNMYQGIYSAKQLKRIERENKAREKDKKPLKVLQPLNEVDFEDINDSFYESFLKFLYAEGYKINTVGRFIKNLKYLMKKSVKIHKNRDFQEFETKSTESFAIALTENELDKIYYLDLSKPELKREELARDSFIAMAETGVRVSDRKHIIIREIEGENYIEFTQQKTGKMVTALASPRFMEIWNKYGGKLPTIHENYINKLIKDIAFRCGIVETEKVPDNKYMKSFERLEKRYKLIGCHSARRSFATNWKRTGLAIEDISILLGHATIKQTEIYLKIGSEEKAKAIAKRQHTAKLRAV